MPVQEFKKKLASNLPVDPYSAICDDHIRQLCLDFSKHIAK